VPMLSPTSVASRLSDGRAYPYFLRNIPADSVAADAMVDVLKRLFNYTRLALVHSTDPYGTSGGPTFYDAALASWLLILTTQRFAGGAVDFSAQLRGLQQSQARVIVLICHVNDGSRFLNDAYEVGVGGDGYLWLGSDTIVDSSLWEGDTKLAADISLRQLVLKGLFAVAPNGQPEGSDRYHEYLMRRQRLPSTLGDGALCNLEKDDDGNNLWAQDHDSNTSTSLACAGHNTTQDGPYDAYGYDAAFSIAHALHDLIEVQNRTEISGSELLDTLIKRVRFDGVTGLVDFHDATGDPDRLYHGDRRVGIVYKLLNYVDVTQGLVNVGRWMPCAPAPCAWSERWHPKPDGDLTYSTADNSQPQENPPQRVTVVRVGILLRMFATQANNYSLFSSRSQNIGAVYQALREINNKSDGVADGLLPRTQLLFAYRDSKCDATSGLIGALGLTRDVFDGLGVHAIIGAGCSSSSTSAARVAGAAGVPLISPSATSPGSGAE
jgi:hypothetical protein